MVFWWVESGTNDQMVVVFGFHFVSWDQSECLFISLGEEEDGGSEGIRG